MAQSVKYPPTANFLQKTLGAQLLAGATLSATLNNVTSIQNKPGVMIVDRVDSNNVETPTKREVIVYTATSGVTVTGLTRNADASGTDQDHAVGAIVEFGPDVMWAQSLIDGLTATIDPATGLLDTTKVVNLTTAQALTNKTLTDSTNNVMAKSLKSATTTVDVSAATAPSAGQVLTATSSTAATWQSGSSSDGWITATGTWTYASASTITVPSGAAAIYTVGDRIKWTQTTVRYGVIVAVADTLLTIAVNTDYVVANAAITLNYYSHDANPVGYPHSFTQSANAKISVLGKQATIVGWGYNTGAGASPTEVSKTVTFGITFAAAPTVNMGVLGGKNSAGAPSAITDFTTNWTLSQHALANAITTSQFTAYSFVNQNLSANQFPGFAYTVVGDL